MARPIITLTTDFGLKDGYVAAMKGVILGICPEARIVDVTHLIPPQDIPAAAYVLESIRQAFPPETIHIVVVDPGVGTERKGIVVRVEDQVLVGPDNGLFSLALRSWVGVEAFYLEVRDYWRPEVSRTFHGRDVFAPVAAHCACGVPLERLGPAAVPEVSPWSVPVKEGPDLLRGEVIAVDHFGNCVSNITAVDLGETPEPGEWTAEISGRRDIPVLETYADVDPGTPVALMGSGGCLEIALNRGNAAKALGVQRGAWVWVNRRLWARRGRSTGGFEPSIPR